MKKPELLSPIQDFTSLHSAIENKADAVYFGVQGFNMRAGAKNFAVKDLKKIVKICHNSKVKCYLALNTIIYENELLKVEKILKSAKLAGIDAIICWDMAIIKLAKKLNLEIHLSTQASISNSTALEQYKKLGIKRVVLARECDLDDIKKIKKKIKIKLETFIHGAMCVSVSGRCFLSQYLYNKSANRGECLQPCRRKYSITQTDFTDIKTEKSLELGEDYVLSPKDLCTLPFIEKLIEAGIDVFKIEGRNRSPEYVATVTKVYRQAIDFYTENKKTIKQKNTLNKFNKLKKQLLQELKKVYNRGFSSGFYLGQPINQWTYSYGSQATQKKIHLGKVNHYYSKIKVAEILIKANKILKLKDTIQFQGETTGVFEQKINSIEINHKKIKSAKQNDLIAVQVNKKVRKGDEVYKIV
ncbi:peptidase U32 family protein [Patescibacteria group bacterium]